MATAKTIATNNRMTGNTRYFRPRRANSYDNTACCEDKPSRKNNKRNGRPKHNSFDRRHFVEHKMMLAKEKHNSKLHSGEDLRQYIEAKKLLKEQQNSRLIDSNDRRKSTTIRRSGHDASVLEALLKELTITDESEPSYIGFSCSEGRQDVTSTNDVGDWCYVTSAVDAFLREMRNAVESGDYEVAQKELLTGLVMSTSETMAPTDYGFQMKRRNEFKMRNSVLKEYRYHPYA